ncbi:Hypothetical protein HVR_LOCUS1168 [uncultured virus]|nr:Hypothetical protein HVR_LOCUS1168 [uncultured virus]
MSYAGASYQINNNPDGNSLIIRKILNNGNSEFSSSIQTGGKGSTLTNSDPLFSQNSVTRYGDYLFAVNAGSNNISMFKINPNDPVNVSFITVAPTVGEYPVSIAANSQYVGVLNGGTNSGINFYTWNSSGITPLNGWNRSVDLNPPQGTPPNGPANTVSDIIFSPDNRSVIVSYKGHNQSNPGGILIYPIQNSSLAANPVKSVPQGSALSFGMTPVGNSALLVADASRGFSVFSYNSSTGETNAATTPLFEIPPSQGRAICWSTFSRQTGNYYLVGAGSASIVEVNVNADEPFNIKSTIVKSYELPASGLTDANVLTISGQDYLYVNATDVGPNNTSVIVMKLNGPGQASIVQTDTSIPADVASPGISGMAVVNNSARVDAAAWFWLLLLIILIIIILLALWWRG